MTKSEAIKQVQVYGQHNPTEWERRYNVRYAGKNVRAATPGKLVEALLRVAKQEEETE